MLMCEVAVSQAKSVLPFKSLDTATESGTDGTSIDLGGVSNEYTVHHFTTGSPTAAQVTIMGSLDGVNWFGTGVTSLSATGYASSTVTNGEEISGTPDRIYMPHVRYIRARLSTLSGGTSPTVTAWVAVGHVI
jgi:hypothetical protein